MNISAKMRVIIEVDVTDVESITQAREAAFELAKPLLNSKRGRKAAGPRAIVTGIQVQQPGESLLLTTTASHMPYAVDAVE